MQQEYFGPYKVFGLQREDFTTPSGAEVVRVLFESIPPRIMPLATYKLLASKEPTDLTTIGNKKSEAIINAVVSMMMEYDPTALEAEFCLNQITVRMTNMFDKASHVALTKAIYGKAQLEEWVPGTNFSHYRTLLEADSIVRQAMKDAKQPDTAQEGDK